MLPPKKKEKEKEKGVSNKISQERKERLMALQQREQLKGMIVNKFIEKYGGGKINNNLINKEVSEFIKNSKVTEDNLRKLEQKIKNQSGIKKVEEHHVHVEGNDAKSTTSSKKHANQALISQEQHHQHQHNVPDEALYSDTSSRCQKSIYQLANEEDEWAMIMKFDQELYKKEKELEKMREIEQKKKIKNELDRQLEEKRRYFDYEKKEEFEYNDMRVKQLDIYDTREKNKEAEKKRKILQEKLSRDKQLQDDAQRKKQQKRLEKEMGDLLVHRIKEELDTEQKIIYQRKLEERDHLKKVLLENEENKAKMLLEEKKERLADIKAQEEYTRLIEKQEAEREKEMKKREERAKQFMAMMSDTVIKDQKEQILEEERKILKHYQDREEREKQEEINKQKRLMEQKRELREFLNKQVMDKNKKKQLEEDLSCKQAQFWKKDTEEFYENEKRKNETAKEINKRHAEILKQQMKDNNSKKKKGKMTVEELLQNKAVLKEMQVQNNEGFEKNIIKNK